MHHVFVRLLPASTLPVGNWAVQSQDDLAAGCGCLFVAVVEQSACGIFWGAFAVFDDTNHLKSLPFEVRNSWVVLLKNAKVHLKAVPRCKFLDSRLDLPPK